MAREIDYKATQKSIMARMRKMKKGIWGDFNKMSDSEKENAYNQAAEEALALCEDAFGYACHHMGLSGFQAGWVSMRFLFDARSMKLGGGIYDYSNLLYPQYAEHFKTAEQLICENRGWLVDEAKKLLAREDIKTVHPDVVKHWKMIAERKDCEKCDKRFKCFTKGRYED